MNEQLHIIAEVLLNYNPKPCIHFNKHFLPLYLTCKSMYNKFVSEKRQVFKCDICHFREIICYRCKINNTKSCNGCKCKGCYISINLTGCFLDLGLRCNKCSKASIVFREYMSAFHRPNVVTPIQCNFTVVPLRGKLKAVNESRIYDNDETENEESKNIKKMLQDKTGHI